MLRDAILKDDPMAAIIARQAGPQANPDIIPLTQHQKADVRLTAVYCLTETGGTDAALAMVRLFTDPNAQVRGAVTKGLNKNPDPAIYTPLLGNYTATSDPVTRREIMLLLGQMKQAKASDLQKACGAETNPIAREGCVTALARLGEPTAKEEFLRNLQEAKGDALERYLSRYAPYINASWMLPGLAPFLDNQTGIVWIGVDARPEKPSMLRACDLVVNLLASVGKAQFSFPVASNVNYTPEQVAEAKAFLKAYRP